MDAHTKRPLGHVSSNDLSSNDLQSSTNHKEQLKLKFPTAADSDLILWKLGELMSVKMKCKSFDFMKIDDTLIFNRGTGRYLPL